MKKPVVAIVSALALVGVASWTWVALDGRDAGAHAQASHESEDLIGDVPGAVVAQDEALNDVEAPTSTPSAAQRSRVANSAPRAQAAKTASYQLTGRVIDGSGTPVQGADVRLSDRSGGLGLGVNLLAASASVAGSQTTRSDEEGRFRFDLDGAGSQSLVVGADYFAPFRKQIMLPEDASLEIGDLQLDAGAVLSGRVVDSHGEGISGVGIESMSPRGGTQIMLLGSIREAAMLTHTDASGQFTLKRIAVGPWRLRASSPAYPSAEASGHTQRGGERSLPIRISLEDGYEIRGSIFGLPDELPTGLLVSAVRVGASSVAGEMEELSWDPFGGQRVKLEPGGGFRLRGLRAGQMYSLRLLLAENFGTRRRSESVQARPGDRGVRLYYNTPSSLTFQLIDAVSGEPVEHYDLASGGFTLRSPGEGLVAFDSAKYHPEGRTLLEDFQGQASILGGSDSITIESVGYESRELGSLDMVPGQQMDLGSIALQPVPVVRIHVRDALTGAPLVGARVSMTPESEVDPAASSQSRFSISLDLSGGEESLAFSDGSEDEGSHGVTDEEGICTLTSLPGETVGIHVEHEEHAPFDSEPLCLAKSGDVEFHADLEQGFTVEVLVLGSDGTPLQGMQVKHREPSGANSADPMAMLAATDRGVRKSDSDGKLYFENLSLGTHGFALQEDPFASPFGMEMLGIQMGGPAAQGGLQWNELEVRPGAVLSLTLEASPQANISGLVLEAGQTLAGARVRLLPRSKKSSPFAGLSLAGMGPASGPSSVTDSTGRYELGFVPVGDYRLEITHATRQMPSEIEVELDGGLNNLDIALSVATLEGRVTSPEGKPLAGLKVSVSEAEGEADEGAPRMRVVSVMMDGSGSAMSISSGAESMDVSTDEDGYYQLRGVAPDRRLVVEASGANYAAVKSGPVEVREGETLDGIDLKLRAAGDIHVRIHQADGSPKGGYLMSATHLTDASVEPKTAFIGPDGEGRLTGLLEGAWELSLRPMGGPGAGATSAAPEPRGFEVTAGSDESIDIQVD